MLQQRARTFTAFSFILGLTGFAGLVCLLRLRPAPVGAHLTEAAILILLAALSWHLGFSILSRTRFSLDLSYMITALLALPSPLPVVVGAGTAALGSILRRRTERGAPGGLVSEISFLMVNSGTLIAMMLAGEAAVISAPFGPAPHDGLSLILFLEVCALFLVLAAVNLALMGFSVFLRGEFVSTYLVHHARHVLPLELYNIPLALLMIVTRSRVGLGGFLLLAGITLVVSLLLKSLYRAQEKLTFTNEELALRADELFALNTIGKEISSSLDLSRVFETIHRQVARLLEASTFCVALYDKDRSEIRHAYFVKGDRVQAGRSYALGRDVLSWVIKSARPLHVDEILQESSARPFDLSETDSTLRSLLAIPLLRPDSEVMGVLMAGSLLPGVYTARHRRLLTSIAQHAAIAIENARYYEMATVDQATRLYLKDYFNQRLEQEINRARRYGRPFTLLMMDLDGFKRVNDEFGHPAGDRLLRQVGEVIRADLRSIDIPCRYGGDEFAILLPETDHAEGVVIAERIRRHVGETVLHDGGRRFGSTISIGIASYPRSGRRGIEDLIKKADAALYQAKRDGKDKIVSVA